MHDNPISFERFLVKRSQTESSTSYWFPGVEGDVLNTFRLSEA